MALELEHMCVNTFSTEDMHRRIGLLQECLEEVLYTHNDAQGSQSVHASAIDYARTAGTHEDAHALSEWGTELWSLFTVQNMIDQIAQLRTLVDALPTMVLYVPVPLDTAATALLGAWCRTNIQKNILLDLQIDPSVIGGCGVVIGDTYRDLSLHERLEESRGIITALLNSYV